jgi:two-component system, response regulator
MSPDGTPAIEILLVEDDDDDAELILRSLRHFRIANQVHRSSDGAAALEALLGEGSGRLEPRFVLLDLKLPLVDGFEVLARLRADPRTHDLPVVIMSSSRMPEDVERAYELGANSFVTKPLDFEEFTEAVRAVGVYWLMINQPPTTARRPRDPDGGALAVSRS